MADQSDRADDRLWDGGMREAFGARPPPPAASVLDGLCHAYDLQRPAVVHDGEAIPLVEATGPGNRGRYHVLGEIARSAGTIVQRAWDVDLGRSVALLIPRSVRHDDPADALRFLAKVRILARLEHPCIASVYDMGLDAQGRPYLAARLVQGRSLAASTEMSAHARTAAFERVCEVVAYAHDAGVAHRGLAADSIWIAPRGELYVLDWWEARTVAEGGNLQDDVAALRRLAADILPDVSLDLADAAGAADCARRAGAYLAGAQAGAREAERAAAQAKARRREDAARLAHQKLEAEQVHARLSEARIATRRERERRRHALRRTRLERTRWARALAAAAMVLVALTGGAFGLRAHLRSQAEQEAAAADGARAALGRAAEHARAASWQAAAREAEVATTLGTAAGEALSARARGLLASYREQADLSRTQAEARAQAVRQERIAFARSFATDAAEDLGDPHGGPVYAEARCLYAQGERTAARERLRDAAARDGNPWVAARAADWAAREGRWVEASEGWTAVVALRPDEAVGWTRLAESLLEIGEAGAALRYAACALACAFPTEVDEGRARRVHGRALLERGAWAEALGEFERATLLGAAVGPATLARARAAAGLAGRLGEPGAEADAPLRAWMLARSGRLEEAARLAMTLTSGASAPEEAVRILLRAGDPRRGDEPERAQWRARGRERIDRARARSQDPVLRPYWLPSGLARLPVEEADAWRTFWETRP